MHGGTIGSNVASLQSVFVEFVGSSPVRVGSLRVLQFLPTEENAIYWCHTFVK